MTFHGALAKCIVGLSVLSAPWPIRLRYVNIHKDTVQWNCLCNTIWKNTWIRQKAPIRRRTHVVWTRRSVKLCACACVCSLVCVCLLRVVMTSGIIYSGVFFITVKWANSMHQHTQPIVSMRSNWWLKKAQISVINNWATVKLLRHVTLLPPQRVAFVLWWFVFKCLLLMFI